MSRIPFYIFKPDGSTRFNHDIFADQINVYKNGVLMSNPLVQINGDGTAWFVPSGSGKYSVYSGSTKQEAFFDAYVLDNDNILSGSVNTNHFVFNGSGELVVSGNVLYQSDIKNTLNNTSSINPLSANQAVVLNYYVSKKENKDDTILKQSKLVSDFTTATSASQIQNAESLKVNYDNTNFLTASLSMNTALRELDRQIKLKFSQFDDNLNKSNYLIYGYSGSISVNNTSSVLFLNTDINATQSINNGFVLPQDGKVKSMSIQFYTNPSFPSTGVNFANSIVIDGTPTSVFNYATGSIGYNGSYINNLDLTVNSGSIIGYKVEVTETATDGIITGDFVGMIEIQYQTSASAAIRLYARSDE